MTAKKRSYSTTSSLMLVVVIFLTAAVFVTVSLVNNFRSPVSKADITETVNNIPKGNQYDLSLIGVPKDKTAYLSGDRGQTIFVPLSGFCQIKLSPGEFQVLDGNCIDGASAFQLPNPDSDNDGVTFYSVWIRSYGESGESLKTPCAYNGEEALWCSINSMISVSVQGEEKNTLSNVTKQLLYVYSDLDEDENTKRHNIFSDSLKDNFWQYDSNGLILAQLRFYDMSADINQ